MNKEHISYLDTIRSIAIFLVIFEHLALVPKNSVIGSALMYLTYGAVPCFMMVTGGLFHKRNSFDVRHYIYQFFKIYFLLAFWKGVYLLFYEMIIYGKNIPFSPKEILSYLFVFGYLTDINSGLFWYLNAYLSVMLLYPVTFFLFHGGKNSRKVLGYFTILLCVCLAIIKIKEIYFLNEDLRAVLPEIHYANMFAYFVLGAFLLEYHEKIQDFFRKRMRLIILIVSILFGIVLMFIQHKTQTGMWCFNDVPVDRAYYHPGTFLIALGLYITSMCIFQKENWVGKVIGKYTLGVYFLHGLLIPLLQSKCSFLYETLCSNIIGIIIAIIILVLCTGITILLSKIPILRNLIK